MPRFSFDTVTIDGFRALRHLELHGLGLINILVGENNSGKTSVLEALSILCNPLDPLEWLRMVQRRDFGGLDETRVQSLRWCFPQTGQLGDPDFMFESSCEMACEGTFPLRSLGVEYKDIEGVPSKRDQSRMVRFKGDDVGDTRLWRGGEISHRVDGVAPFEQSALLDKEKLTVRIWEIESYFTARNLGKRGRISTETLTPYTYQLNRHLLRQQSAQVFSDQQDMILELIRDFDPDIVNVKLAAFRGNRAAIYVNHKKLGPAPLSVFGDALRRAVLLASTLPMLQGGGLLLIDEVETGIHVSALKKVFSWLTKVARQLQVQVVATTHSLEAVDAIALSVPENVEDVVVFRLDQTEEKTRAKRIEGELLLRLRLERGLDVR